MIRYIIPALLLALIVAAPAAPQGGPVPADEQIATLVGEVSLLKDKVAKQEALLKELVAYHQTRKADNEKLAGALQVAYKAGYTYPSPQPKAREALYQAILAYANDGTRNVPTGETKRKRKPKK